MLKEFKKFIAKGNVFDMAVGIIVGSAFTSIVSSLVKNIINPFVGIFLGKVDLSNLVFKVGHATFKYGVFINSIINFLIIAFVVFIMIKLLNKANVSTKKESKEDPKEQYLKEIVTLLKEDQK